MNIHINYEVETFGISRSCIPILWKNKNPSPHLYLVPLVNFFFFFFEKPLVNFKLKHLICKPYSKPARDL